MIKTALMDQSVIAGIGNIYADEILYQTSIYPESDVRRLDSRTLRGMHSVMQRILRTAIAKDADSEKFPKISSSQTGDPARPAPGVRGKSQRSELMDAAHTSVRVVRKDSNRCSASG